MPGGRSGVAVYRAYPELAIQASISHPMPHFVKIGGRGKIIDEYENYGAWVEPYVPFHLGPHLNHARCCVGARLGVLVGDFIEASESLVDCARTGRANAAVSCLFEKTLFGWYRAERKVDISLVDSISSRFPNSIAEARLARAQELGASKSLEQLRTLLARCKSMQVLIGPTHGDLHADNIRVRANDAILIDFLSHQEGPLVYDIAMLEVSLLIEGFAADSVEAGWNVNSWLTSILPLYDCIPFCKPLLPSPKERYRWFHECVRQLRHYAQRMELDAEQYPVALAVALVAKAAKDPGCAEPEASRRATAYMLAERILLKLYGEQATDLTEGVE